METLCLRYFNVFGPYQDPEGPYAAVIPAFVAKILRRQRPVIFGDGEQSRDFCYIDNVCQANWLAAHAESQVCDGTVVNIACHAATSLNQIIKLLQELMHLDIQPEYAPPRAGDVRDSLADVALAKQVIGYEPKVFFEEGLRKAIDWYTKNL
jgi:nucleoside-diphosphate-sugar epimerase